MIINSQQQRIVSLSKQYAVTERVVVLVSYYNGVLSEKKKSGDLEKVKFGMDDH